MPRLTYSMMRVGALTVALACLGCSGPRPTIISNSSPTPTGAGAAGAGDLRFQVPAGWVVENPTSSMRVAQYRLPRAEGDAEDTALVVYYFGQGQGGSVQANLDRWIGQMQQPDGRPSKESAKTEKMTVNGMAVTLLDVTGTYAGGDMMAGAGASKQQPAARMRAGVIETPKGAYFIKLVGPEKTVARWDQAFMEFVKSAEFKP